MLPELGEVLAAGGAFTRQQGQPAPVAQRRPQFIAGGVSATDRMARDATETGNLLDKLRGNPDWRI